jgi:SepF-like predicted cell division protein (DUF552 family)
MGFVSDLVRGETSSGYAELDDGDLESPPNSRTQVAFVDVKSQDDLVNAKEALHDGKLVFLDIAYIESNGLSLEAVYSSVNEAVQTVNGDIVHKKRNDTIIATPRDVNILRQKL